MLGRKKGPKKESKTEGAKKISVLFVDEMNDLQSQIAEYFLTTMYPDVYEVRSAGPKYDFVDCELVATMYQNGHDIRRATSKDVNANNMIPYDFIVFLQKETYDRIHDVIPFAGKQILKYFGSRKDLKATDDKELFECYTDLAERVREWVKGTFSSPENLEKLVI
jgi:protein-tyrosine-phosphatase